MVRVKKAAVKAAVAANKEARAPAPAPAPKLRVVTFQQEVGSGFRLVTPFGNRDFEGGVLSTDSNDPACDWLLEWAGDRKDIKVTDSGVVTKTAVKVCPTCNIAVDGELALADHNEAVHVAPESKGQPKTLTPRE